jgi:putative nucleotidyltransferase with HDIG domain
MSNDIHLDRDKCLEILQEYTKGEGLLKHAYAVEACMRAYAEKFGEDPQYWGNIGLLHDFDYEQFPTAEEHPYKGNEILAEKGFSEEFRDIIMSHADYTGVPRDSLIKRTLFAVDELAGFITAVTLVRPNKDINEVKVKSVKKKLKDKAFAKSVNRDDIYNGAEELDIPLEEHIQFCINAMRSAKDKLEL